MNFCNTLITLSDQASAQKINLVANCLSSQQSVFRVNYKMIEVKSQETAAVLKLNSFWLRDHCRCAECYSVETKQRKYNLIDIPANVSTVESCYTNGGKVFQTKWSDGHISEYDIRFLFDAQMEQLEKRKSELNLRTPWNKETMTKGATNECAAHVALNDLIGSDVAARRLLTSLIRYGIAFVEDVVPANTVTTEMAIRCVFPVMKTFFGEMYTFSDEPDHADTAYTKKYLGSHTDNTYFCDAAGLQVLHCLEHIGGSGGENFFVDGLHTAQELKRKNPKAFEILSRVHVPAEYIEDGQNHTHSAPVIRVNPRTGEIIQLRLNVYDRAAFNTLPQSQMNEFYESFREFLQLVQSETNQWTFKLHPKTVMIFDNWRVFHARHAYTGFRKMTGCYVQRTDFLSKARVLGIID